MKSSLKQRLGGVCQNHYLKKFVSDCLIMQVHLDAEKQCECSSILRKFVSECLTMRVIHPWRTDVISEKYYQLQISKPFTSIWNILLCLRKCKNLVNMDCVEFPTERSMGYKIDEIFIYRIYDSENELKS